MPISPAKMTQVSQVSAAISEALFGAETTSGETDVPPEGDCVCGLPAPLREERTRLQAGLGCPFGRPRTYKTYAVR